MIYLCDISNIDIEKKEYKSSASFVGRLLLKYALLQRGINLDEYNISYNPNGKPYINEIKYYFNISHSCNLVCVVIDENECGIDIEFVDSSRNFNKIVDTYFNNLDKETYNQLNDLKKVNFFYNVWVQIETHIKKLGLNILNAKNLDYDRYVLINIKDKCGLNYFLATSTNETEINIIEFNNLL